MKLNGSKFVYAAHCTHHTFSMSHLEGLQLSSGEIGYRHTLAHILRGHILEALMETSTLHN